MDQLNHFQRLPPKHMYQLPYTIVVERARKRLAKEQKFWRTLQDTALVVLLLALVFIIAFESTDRRSFYINKTIQDTFVAARHSGDIALTEVEFSFQQ